MLILSLGKGTEIWWYDTILSYPTGYFYYCYQKAVEQVFKCYYLIILLILLGIFYVTHDYGPFYWGLRPNVMGITFALIVVMITMKVRIGNKWLQWCGTNLFPLYIYQRIPMIALSALLGAGFVSAFPFLYVVINVLITCIIARYYKYWMID